MHHSLQQGYILLQQRTRQDTTGTWKDTVKNCPNYTINQLLSDSLTTWRDACIPPGYGQGHLAWKLFCLTDSDSRMVKFKVKLSTFFSNYVLFNKFPNFSSRSTITAVTN